MNNDKHTSSSKCYVILGQKAFTHYRDEVSVHMVYSSLPAAIEALGDLREQDPNTNWWIETSECRDER